MSESSSVDRRECEIGIGHIGSPDDDEVQMDSGMCPADAVGVYEVENQAGSNHLVALCEGHRDLLDEGPGLIVQKVAEVSG